jgi:uncharacterized protein (TIGR02231 family)
MKIGILFCAMLVSGFIFSQEVKTQKVASKIQDITVFLTGGEVHRTATAKLKAGRNKLFFTQISTVADVKSLQCNASVDLNLVSLSSEIDYITVSDQNPRIKVMKDSIEILKSQVMDLSNEKSAYAMEKSLLEKNILIKGDQENLTVEQLSAMATYYRKHYLELNKLVSVCDEKINEKSTLQYKYQTQLNELTYKESIRSNQFVVIVDSEIDQTVEFDLKYMVSNCGWQANYDIRATTLQDAVELVYKAKVYNNTGNDWTDVKISLSTSDPQLSASAPELAPWYLNYASLDQETNDDYRGKEYIAPDNRGYDKYYQNANWTPQMNQNLDGLYLFGNAGAAQGSGNLENSIAFKNIQVSQLSTTFEIAKKYTIPSDSKPYLVEISEHSLKASFSHKAVPKLVNDAYLLANIVGWETLDLVPGPTQVYFSDVFVGQSFINTSNVADTLRLSFGRDSKIPVTRKLEQEFSEKKEIGSNRRDKYTYSIVCKNNHSTPVRINLYDQIPISQTSDIVVTIEETSAAQYNDVTGKLSWIVLLNPGETKTYKISFTLKYPKDQVIQVKKFRTISAPSF